jgi:hypothetical protein
VCCIRGYISSAPQDLTAGAEDTVDTPGRPIYMSVSTLTSAVQSWYEVWTESIRVLRLRASHATDEVGCLGRLSLCIISVASSSSAGSGSDCEKLVTLINWQSVESMVGQIVRVDHAGKAIMALAGLRADDRWRDLAGCEVRN